MNKVSGGGLLLAGVAGSALICPPSHAQENRFDLSARVVETYDTNELRRSSERFSGPKDNVSISPRIGVDYSRRFGRQRVFLDGTAGYNFNSRFRFLDREDLNFTGGADLRFGARCRVDPTFAFFRAQSDLEDLGAVVRNTATVQDYAVSASCPRVAGFYPVVSGSLLTVNNSNVRRERDQRVGDLRAGLVYRRPSLGTAELYGQIITIRRDRRLPSATGATRDETEVGSVGLALDRAVGTRISASASVAYTNVDPKAPGVRGFSGVTYRGAVTFEPQPRLRFTAGFGRAVSARGNVGSSYYLNSSASLSAQARLTARTSVGAGVQIARRDFRGEDASFQFGPRGVDRQYTASANASYAIASPIALTLTTRYRNRDADNDFYDYSSFAATLGASLRL